MSKFYFKRKTLTRKNQVFKMSSWVFGLTIFLAFILLPGSNAATSCNTTGFYLSSDTVWCFAFIDNPRDLPSQSVHCRSYGASLLTVESEAKKNMITTFLTEFGHTSSSKSIGMGLTNVIGTQTDWAWYKTSGALTYTNWQNSYPVTTDRYNCAVFDSQSTTWTNQNCLTSAYAMCQRKASTYEASQ